MYCSHSCSATTDLAEDNVGISAAGTVSNAWGSRIRMVEHNTCVADFCEHTRITSDTVDAPLDSDGTPLLGCSSKLLLYLGTVHLYRRAFIPYGVLLEFGDSSKVANLLHLGICQSILLWPTKPHRNIAIVFKFQENR